jgi:hypothetical protein
VAAVIACAALAAIVAACARRQNRYGRMTEVSFDGSDSMPKVSSTATGNPQIGGFEQCKPQAQLQGVHSPHPCVARA